MRLRRVKAGGVSRARAKSIRSLRHRCIPSRMTSQIPRDAHTPLDGRQARLDRFDMADAVRVCPDGPRHPEMDAGGRPADVIR
jgi:hypothetical protein